MFKNVKVKKLLKNTVFRFISLLNGVIPKDDKKVMLYSGNMGIRHNLLPLKNYLIDNGYSKRYDITCVVDNKALYENDGLKYITKLNGFIRFLRTRHVFYTTGQIPIKPSKKQIVIQMDHGTTGIKTVGLLSKINNGDDFYFTYYCAPSEIYRDIVKAEFNCSDSNIIINSEPVTDVLFKEHGKSSEFSKYKKIGLWLPTFRQSDYLGYDDSKQEDLLPTLKKEDYDEFNNILREKEILIIAKLHDGQDLKEYKNVEYSNLRIYSGKDFLKHGYELYDLLCQTDFIIGDYSSVCLQYLPLNRPIGYAIPDIDEYAENRGFVFSPIEDYMPGKKIKTKEELIEFIDDIANEVDEYQDERKRVNQLVNHYQDGNSCKRLIIYSDMK